MNSNFIVKTVGLASISFLTLSTFESPAYGAPQLPQKKEPACETLLSPRAPSNNLAENLPALQDKGGRKGSPKSSTIPSKKSLIDRRKKVASKLNLVNQDALDELIEMASKAEVFNRADQKPIATQLLLGPKGSGKDRFAEALAMSLHGDSSRILTIDCSTSLREGITHRKGANGLLKPVLTTEDLKSVTSESSAISIVVFDKIDSIEEPGAREGFANLLINSLAEGRVPGSSEQVDLSKTLILFRSDLDPFQINTSQPNEQRPQYGFVPSQSTGESEKGTVSPEARVNANIQYVLRTNFSPTTLNNLGGVVLFGYLPVKTLARLANERFELWREKNSAILRGIHINYNRASLTTWLALNATNGQSYGTKDAVDSITEYLLISQLEKQLFKVVSNPAFISSSSKIKVKVDVRVDTNEPVVTTD
ncbi:MAG: hypothetical protein COT74_09085 [Bdellovibrionales bacterium CG10_big_fil_rev_8_21_14_0_10_45_34]|nr:MAG: hypothetical protein COT74_09085 [Bdellovibrionales bacterium CG10_big_fil_rev_8_21_14_0_10_45_34]